MTALESTIRERQGYAYRDGRTLGLVAWAHLRDGRPDTFGRRHTTLDEARRFAAEARFPCVNLDPAEKRCHRAFWLGYLRTLRGGVQS